MVIDMDKERRRLLRSLDMVQNSVPNLIELCVFEHGLQLFC